MKHQIVMREANLLGLLSLILFLQRLNALLSGPVTSSAGLKVLPCSTTSEATTTFWTWSFQDELVVQSETCMLRRVSLSSRYSLQSTHAGECNLVLKNVSLDDAGKYQCSDSRNLSNRVSAQLVVVGHLQCSHHTYTKTLLTPTDSITIRCSLDYNDPTISNEPILNWSGQLSDSLSRHVVHNGPNQVVLEVTKPLVELTDELHPILPPFVCSLSFSTLHLPQGHNHTCSTHTLQIYYPPQDVRILTPTGGFGVEAGRNLLCITKSNPSSVFRWSFVDDDGGGGGGGSGGSGGSSGGGGSGSGGSDGDSHGDSSVDSDGGVLKGLSSSGGTGNSRSLELLSTNQSLSVSKSGLYACTASNIVNGKVYNRTASAHIHIVRPLSVIKVVAISSLLTVLGLIGVYVVVFCSCADWRSVVIV